MNEFMKALITEERNPLISEQKDYFGQLIGEWDIDWRYDIGTKREGLVKGEWIFSRVINGIGIQDLFICPSREERKKLKKFDTEYGTTIRTYNPTTGNWDIYYCCYGESVRLEAKKEGARIVLTEKESGTMKWIFSEIEENSFYWQNVMLDDKGKWVLCCDCRATRRNITN